MRRLAAVVPLVLALVIPLQTQELPPAWPMYGHDARHTGRTPLLGPQTPEVAWRLETGTSPARINTVPAVGADGTIYLPIVDRHVLAVNPDGTVKWTFEAFWSTIGSSPAIGAGGTIHVRDSGFDHTVYAINPDGTTRWRFPTFRAAATPTIAPDGTIYFTSDGGLYSVRSDGALNWRFQDCRPIPFPGRCTFAAPDPPAVGPDGTVYIANDAGCGGDPPFCVPGVFYAIRPDGRLRWRVPLGLTGIYAPSIGAFGTIYFVTESGWLVAMRANGSVRWVYEVPSPTAPQAIGAGGVIYVPTAEGLHAVGPFGIRRWFAATPQPLGDIPAIGGDGTIYVNADFQDVYAFNPDGTLKWTRQFPGVNVGGVAIGPGGRLYVATGASAESFSYLYALGAS